MRKTIWIISGVLALALAGAGFMGIYMKPLLKGTVLPYDDQLTLFLGQGGNSLVLADEDGKTILVVDSKMGAGAKQLRAYVDKIAPRASIILVNTHYHSDHVKGNQLFPKAYLIAGNYGEAFWQDQVGDRLPDEWIDRGQEKVMPVGSEMVHIRNMGQGHSMNDTVVYLEKHKLLATGDLVFNGWHPAMFRQAGSDIQQWIRALDDLMGRFETDRVVPGHGQDGGPQVLADQREYFASIEAAADNPEQLAKLRKKYAGFFSLPGGMSGFDKTLEFVGLKNESLKRGEDKDDRFKK